MTACFVVVVIIVIVAAADTVPTVTATSPGSSSTRASVVWAVEDVLVLPWLLPLRT